MKFGWNWITERIALGGEFESPQDIEILYSAGITHVINCREVCDPDYVEKAFEVCWPMPRQPDDGKPRTAVWFANGLSFWESEGKYPYAKLYVHCHAGMNRSASMVYAILRTMGIKPKDARHLIVTNRPLDFAGAWSDNILGLRYADEADKCLTSK